MKANSKYFVLALGLLLFGLLATVVFWPAEKPVQAPAEINGRSESASPRIMPDFGAAPEVFQDSLQGGGLGPMMVKVSSGVFEMGSAPSSTPRSSNERLHQVSIENSFAISVYEVSFEEFDRYCEASGAPKPDDEGWGRARRPVVNVTWYDALAYASWLSEQSGHRYRLPTEAEWEYMARAGSTGPHWWGDSDLNGALAVCDGCGGRRPSSTAAVGSLQANAFGVYDVLGNVWEWTCSNYVEDYNGSEQRCVAEEDDAVKVIRGGGWGNTVQFLRSAKRDKFVPGDKNEIVGFRLARDL